MQPSSKGFLLCTMHSHVCTRAMWLKKTSKLSQLGPHVFPFFFSKSFRMGEMQYIIYGIYCHVHYLQSA